MDLNEIGVGQHTSYVAFFWRAISCRVPSRFCLAYPAIPVTVLFGTGHDNTVTPERARSALEFEMSIHAGCNIHVHWQYPDCGQSLWASAAHVWTAHDGAVQRGRPGGVVTPCIRDSRLRISPDEKRDAESINFGKRGMGIEACVLCLLGLTWHTEKARTMGQI